MAELLKNQFGSEIPKTIAGMLKTVAPEFPAPAFMKEVLQGYDALELMPRGRHIAQVLRKHLPADYEEALALLVASTTQQHAHKAALGMTSFLYMPHLFFVRDFGLEHFEASMQAQYVLTQRFTAEFSIRAFLERHPQQTLQRLHKWASDPNHHVRRLVSEGTRPRLPWAGRLREFQRDPRPVLALLELLKDDPELYVRRSVANNLNDIGKDNPDLLYATAKNWLQDASEERRWVVQHALRSAIKRGEVGALQVMGVGKQPTIAVTDISITPAKPKIGTSVVINFGITNTARQQQRLLVDFRIHFVKANGQAKPKVFKLKTITLERGASASFSKKVSLAELTTRKHYPGKHQVDALVNGSVYPLGGFQLTMPR